MECGTVAFVSLGPEISTMGSDDGLADCQPKAEALWFGGVEGLEDLVAILAQTVAIVPHGKPQPPAFVHAGKRQRFFPGPIVLHRLAGIFYEIQKNLLDGNPVRLDHG